MKKIYTLLLGITLIGFSFNVVSQTTVDITSTGPDTNNFYCLSSASVYYYVSISTQNYTLPDSVSIRINWGDGTIDLVKEPIVQSPGLPNQRIWHSTMHVYTGAGTYVPHVIVTGSDGKADTASSSLPIVVGSCGNYSGRVYADNNGNCVFDAGDDTLRNIGIEIYDPVNNITFYDISGANGEYDVDLITTISYNIKAVNPYLTLACPTGGYTGATAPSTGNDFGFVCNSGFDLLASINGQGFRPGFPRIFSATGSNSSCIPTNGTMKVVLSDPRIAYSPNPGILNPPTVSGDTIIWSLNNLGYNTTLGGRSNDGFRKFYVNTSLGATIGDTICMEVIIEPSAGDNDPSNNVRTYCFPVANSFDPNEKTAYPAGVGEDHIIEPGTTLDYTIHFQNTGNDVAYNVFILDTLESNLNVSTIHIEGASHPMNFDILEGNILKFSFPNINLPDSKSNEPESHGLVRFRIDHIDNLPLGTEINNRVAIYFDFNDPIITNTVSRTVDVIANTGIQQVVNNDVLFNVYPNPAREILFIELHSENQAELRLRNLTGQVVLTKNIKEGRNAVNVGQLAGGAYIVEVKVDGHQQRERMIIHR